jgi:predicted secreted protein
MGWFTASVLFILIWWTVLFAVLPFGTRPVADADESAGGWRGVPDRPMLRRKIVATTLISLVIWAGGVALIHSPYVSFRQMAESMHDD